MLKTFVVGASGLIGRHYWLACRQQFPDCLGTQHTHNFPDLIPLDLLHPELNKRLLLETGHQAAVVAAACSRVAVCEREPQQTREINVTGTARLIGELTAVNLRTTFLSSDYVFAGTKGDYDEQAEVGPTTEYGRQKAELEATLKRENQPVLVVRLSKVYGLDRGDGTLLDEMASELSAGRSILAADDQVFCPTYVADVVRLIAELQQMATDGLIHLCAPEPCSRYQLARMLAAALDVDPALVQRVSLNQLPGMQNRPLNTSMRIQRLEQILEPHFLSWRQAIEIVAAHYR